MYELRNEFKHGLQYKRFNRVRAFDWGLKKNHWGR